MKEVKSILDFNDGAIVERVNYELKKVMENIQDPNTDEKPRELTIKIKLTPINGRKSIAMVATINKKTRPTMDIQSLMSVRDLNESVVITESSDMADGQTDIFGEIHETKILKIN